MALTRIRSCLQFHAMIQSLTEMNDLHLALGLLQLVARTHETAGSPDWPSARPLRRARLSYTRQAQRLRRQGRTRTRHAYRLLTHPHARHHSSP